MPNYLQILANCFPGAEAYTAGSPSNYADLIWVTTQIDQATLDASDCASPGNSIIDSVTGGTLVFDDNTQQWISQSDVVGKYLQYAVSESLSGTTSTGWVQKVRLTTTDLPTGTYRIGWNATVKSSSTSNTAQLRIEINDTDTLAEVYEEPHDANNWMPRSGWIYWNGSGIVNIDMDYSSTSSSKTTYIRNARLEIWRVG